MPNSSEYWLADPEERSIEVLTLGYGRYGRYQLPGIFQGNDTIPSHIVSGISIVPVDQFLHKQHKLR